MNGIEAGLTAEDHGWRRAAVSYFDEKGKVARSAFDAKILGTFLDFESHWREFFAPADPDALREYLATPFEVRQAQFDRFKRECRSWELTFRHCTKTHASEARKEPAAGSTDWREHRRRVEAQRDRAERVRSLYDHLDSMLDQERQRRSHPSELLVHLRALGMPSDASLEDIKRQYKRLAKLHHPDRHGDPLKMSRISDAYRAIIAFYRVS